MSTASVFETERPALKAEGFAGAILNIIGNPAPGGLREVLRRHFEISVTTALLKFINGDRGLTREWVEKHKIRQVLKIKFPKGWTPKNTDAFREGYVELPDSQFSLDHGSSEMSWRRNICAVMNEIRNISKFPDAKSLATTAIPDNESAARVLTRWLKQIELTGNEISSPIILSLADGLFSLSPKHPKYERLSALKTDASRHGIVPLKTTQSPSVG